jgi:transcriptional regulator with XRE-family HTH domain
MIQPNGFQKDIVSVRIGELIRRRRKELDLTQKDLAKKLNVTAQQIQKYESGVNCLRIDKLIEFCQALALPISYFFLTAYQTQSVLRESSGDSFEGGKKHDNTAGSKITLQEIDTFLLQFLTLKDETKSYIMALVNDLSKAQKPPENQYERDVSREDD